MEIAGNKVILRAMQEQDRELLLGLIEDPEMMIYAFRELGLNYIYSRILENNAASRRLIEKCGFKQIDIHKSRMDKDGYYRNIYFYGMKNPDLSGDE